jgi:hypothetical protein
MTRAPGALLGPTVAVFGLLTACSPPIDSLDAGPDAATDAGALDGGLDASVDAGGVDWASCVPMVDTCGAPGTWRVHFSGIQDCLAFVRDRDLELVRVGGQVCTGSPGALSANGCTVELSWSFWFGPPEPGTGHDRLILTFDGGDVAVGRLAYGQTGLSNCDDPGITATAFRADSGVLAFRGQPCQLTDAGSCPPGLGCYSQVNPACDLEGWLDGGSLCQGDSQCRSGFVCAEPGTGVASLRCVAICSPGAPASMCPPGLSCRAAPWLGATTGLCKP